MLRYRGRESVAPDLPAAQQVPWSCTRRRCCMRSRRRLGLTLLGVAALALLLRGASQASAGPIQPFATFTEPLPQPFPPAAIFSGTDPNFITNLTLRLPTGELAPSGLAGTLTFNLRGAPAGP